MSIARWLAIAFVVAAAVLVLFGAYHLLFAIDPKIEELAGLPVGLKVTHTPNPVGAVRGGPSGERYSWVFKTSVRSLRGPVQIVEFGGFSRVFGKWVFGNFTGRPFTPEDFADWYACPGAVVLE